LNMKRIGKKQAEYRAWLEKEARPFIIERDSNICACCGRPAYEYEKLDIDHIKGVGSHPELKRNVDNMQLLCRVPCHRRKTDHLPCHPK
jgi:5-methylcytosine-specific restriction endonuclease McrA